MVKEVFMRMEVLKTYSNEMSIAVIMPWPYKDNLLNYSGVIYNKTVTRDLHGRLFNAIKALNYKRVMGILKRNRFASRPYYEGITSLYI